LIEIYVRGPGTSVPVLVQSCPNTTSCSYLGGPYTAGDGEYYARARDQAGNEAQSATKALHVDWYIGFLPGAFRIRPM
jgi:hypothetical protein